MKKSTIALAASCVFAGPAWAQSNVTVYGTVDLGVVKSNGGAANNPTIGVATTSDSWQVAQGRSNRLGFRGNEDLGGGLSAQFQIEHRFNGDTGAQSNASTFWQGLSYVQLSSTQAGKLYLGRNLTPAFLLAVRFDPFGWDGVGQMGSLQYGNYRTPDPAAPAVASNGRSVTNNSVRESNAVGYVSPSFSGFSLHAAASLSEATGNGRPTSLNFNYEAGPLYVGVNAERVYGGSYQGQGILQLGASYDFGVTRVMGYLARASYGARSAVSTTYFTGQALPALLGGGTLTTANGNNRAHSNVYQVAAVTPIGVGAIKAGYVRVEPEGPDNRIEKLALGYDHFLSKRTKLYIDASQARERTLKSSRLVALGVRHDF